MSVRTHDNTKNRANTFTMISLTIGLALWPCMIRSMACPLSARSLLATSRVISLYPHLSSWSSPDVTNTEHLSYLHLCGRRSTILFKSTLCCVKKTNCPRTMSRHSRHLNGVERHFSQNPCPYVQTRTGERNLLEQNVHLVLDKMSFTICLHFSGLILS